MAVAVLLYPVLNEPASVQKVDNNSLSSDTYEMT